MTTAVQSLWTPAYSKFPQEMQPLQWTAIRKRFNAHYAAGAICHFGPAVVVSGWNYTNSATLGEASPGTAAAPNRVYWITPGTVANATVRIKADVTYSGGAVTKMALYYSTDNGATYVPMYDELDYYVVTVAYSGANVTSTTWGNVP